MNLARLYTYVTDSFPLLAGLPSPTKLDVADKNGNLSRNQQSEVSPVTVRSMSRDELDTTLRWAADEGWNPGLHDASIYWDTDPEGFLVADVNGEMVGSGSIVRYQPNSFFLGLFMVRKDLRGQGLGGQAFELWQRVMRSRLGGPTREAPIIGLDGVVAMQPFYEANGFNLSHRQTRFRCEVGNWVQASAVNTASIRDLVDLPFSLVEAFDRQHFGAGRSRFLRQWITPTSGAGRAVIGPDGSVLAMGVIRRAYRGWRVGPLFATEAEAATMLFQDLCITAGVGIGEEVYIDVPEVNGAALALANHYQMEREFDCGRMFFGSARPDVPWQKIYGVTTLELG